MAAAWLSSLSPISNHGISPHALPQKREGLQCYEVDGEAVLYDLAHHAVHYLNDSAYWIWKNCDGRITAGELMNKMSVAWIEQFAEAEPLTEAAGESMAGLPQSFFDDMRQTLQNLHDNGLIDCPVACRQEDRVGRSHDDV
ncbi:MAG: PqqD family protein [Phycisphaerae bacterium]|nr:PqqD family protein [Phycisphaerae bacterium]